MSDNKFTLHKSKNPTDEGWHQISGAINSDQIMEIADTEGRKAVRGLTSVPSPFARMHLFNTAFDMVNKEGHQHESVYHRMVSQCLDMLELLFNYQEYRKAKADLSITKWNRDNEIRTLLESRHPNQQLLGRTLQLFLEQEGGNSEFSNVKDVYLIRYNHQLIGGSSPLTLFFTHPDLKPIDLKTPKGDRYFERTVALSQRSDDFQVYIHKLFKGNSSLRTSCRTIFDYLVKSREEYVSSEVKSLLYKVDSSYQKSDFDQQYDFLRDEENNIVNINAVEFRQRRPDTGGIEEKSDFVLQASLPISGVKPLVLKNGFDRAGMIYTAGEWQQNTRVPLKDPLPLDQRVLPDTHTVYPYLSAGDFLEDTILKMPYGINEKNFVTGKHNAAQTQGKVFPYLLPIKRQYFDYFDLNDLQRQLSFEIKESSLAGERITVRLNIPIRKGEINFEKTYYPKLREYPTLERKDEDGEVITCNAGLGIFPFYKVANQPQYNSYYKLMLIDVDDKEDLIQEEYDLKFFAGSTEIQNNVKQHTRRSKKEEIIGTSTYFELDKPFDFIEIHPQRHRRNDIRGLIIPKWRMVNIGGRTFNFAIDFGTTNTHVAYSDDLSPMPKPFNIGEDDLQVVMLNKPAEVESSERALIASKYSKGLNSLREALILQEREFLPSILGADYGSSFRFPIRTATSETENFSTEPASLLGNINMAFSFEKERLDKKAPMKTNLKWKTQLDVKGQQRIEAFFKETLLLIKNKIILNGGDPAKSRIVWFSPLSMSDFQKGEFENTWRRNFETIFSGSGKLTHTTESVAPYYFLRRTNQLIAGENIVNIDIGGGTTDALFFIGQQPRFGSSFKFGANAIWGAGFNAHEFHDKSNGFLQAFKKQARKDAASTRKSTSMGESIEEFYNDLIHYGNDFDISLASSDIISFLFNYDEEAKPQLRFQDFLKNDRHLKVILLLHYSAIIYHIAQLITHIKLHKEPAIEIPRYFVFSGKGSLYLNALGGVNGKGIKALTRHILANVCEEANLQIPANFELVLTREPKEATANGGVLLDQQTSEPDIRPVVLSGSMDTANETAKTKYQDIQPELKSSVLENTEHLISLVLDTEDLNLKNYFGIDTDLELVKNSLRQHLKDGLQEGLSSHAHSKEPLEETLFFYPFIHSLFNLSKELNTTYYE
ncbi:MAG: hypothetical protein V4714_15140 [Bacteroidota bacterium]